MSEELLVLSGLVVCFVFAACVWYLNDLVSELLTELVRVSSDMNTAFRAAQTFHCEAQALRAQVRELTARLDNDRLNLLRGLGCPEELLR